MNMNNMQDVFDAIYNLKDKNKDLQYKIDALKPNCLLHFKNGILIPYRCELWYMESERTRYFYEYFDLAPLYKQTSLCIKDEFDAHKSAIQRIRFSHKKAGYRSREVNGIKLSIYEEE